LGFDVRVEPVVVFVDPGWDPSDPVLAGAWTLRRHLLSLSDPHAKGTAAECQDIARAIAR